MENPITLYSTMGNDQVVMVCDIAMYKAYFDLNLLWICRQLDTQGEWQYHPWSKKHVPS